MRNFRAGFQSFFMGFGFWMKNSSLLRISLLPVIFNFIFIVGGLVYSFGAINDIVNHIVSRPEVWYQYALYSLLYVVAAISLFLIVIFIGITLANLVSFPFNALLAERAVHIHEKGAKGKLAWLKKMFSNLGAMFRRTLIFLVAGGVMILSTLIPGLGIIGVFVGVFLLAYDRLDYGFDIYGWSFADRKKFIKENLGEVLGFAAGLGLTAAIPVVNILAQPGGVVAGALLVTEIKGRTLARERSDSQTPR